MKRNQSARDFVTVCVAGTLFLTAGSSFAQMSRSQNRVGGQSSLSTSRNGGQSGLSTSRTGGQSTTAAGARGEKADKVEIKRMPPPNKTAMVRTPEYNYNVQNTMPKVSKKPREWALFEVKYESASKWTDELTFNYYVMTKGKTDEGKDGYSFYTTTVRYIDVSRGEHMSCVALPPSLVERYGEPAAVALEIVGKDGTVLDSKTETLMPLPKEWWKDSKVLDNPSVARRTGMVDRSKTPFALVNVDDYEVIQ
jgi:hypothetical protein